ncbi:MAG: sulfite exporter TauE/SafE family protein [Gammaproteobacteria bacterium]|nr:sulfite exporter TauE/SafE family protein [Gammaproteobacteria bacterium]
MPADATLVSAFLVGLLGSVHCLGMCGGIVGALTLGLKDDIRRSPRALLPYLAFYNAGRIASYAVAGALLGLVSGRLLALLPAAGARLTAAILSGGFMIALGLYLAGWWPGLSLLERAGGKLWRYLEPLGRRFLPVDHPLKAGLLGLVWGWLPCGMVYAALAWSLTAGGAGRGALLMVAFGLGTLPMLLAMGAAAHGLATFVRRPRVRQGAGVLLLLLGLYTLYTAATRPWHEGRHAGGDYFRVA